MGTRRIAIITIAGLVLLSCFCGVAAGAMVFSAGISIYQSLADIQITALDITSVAIAPYTQTPFPTFTQLPTDTTLPTFTVVPSTVAYPTIVSKVFFTETPTFTLAPPTETATIQPTWTDIPIPTLEPTWTLPSTITMFPTSTQGPTNTPFVFVAPPTNTSSPPRNINAELDQKGCDCTQGLQDTDPRELDCGTFSDYELAQACYDRCSYLGDVYELDGDDPPNGIACEYLRR